MGREQAGRPSNSQLNFPLGQRCLPLCEPFFCIICGSLDSPYPPLWFFLQLPNRYLEPSPDRSGTFFEDFSSFNSISLCTSKQEEGTWLTPLHLIPLVTLKVLQRFFENNNAHLSPWRKLALLWFLFQSHFICIQGLKISTWTLGLILKIYLMSFQWIGEAAKRWKACALSHIWEHKSSPHLLLRTPQLIFLTMDFEWLRSKG